MLRFIEKFFGALVCTSIGKISGHFYLLYGPPRSLKSSLLSIVEHLVGDGNYSNVPLNDLGNATLAAPFETVLVNIHGDLGDIEAQKAQNI